MEKQKKMATGNSDIKLTFKGNSKINSLNINKLAQTAESEKRAYLNGMASITWDLLPMTNWPQAYR